MGLVFSVFKIKSKKKKYSMRTRHNSSIIVFYKEPIIFDEDEFSQETIIRRSYSNKRHVSKNSIF